jgi:hypothetical protein
VLGRVFVPLAVKSRAFPYAEAFYLNVIPVFALLLLLLLVACLIGGRPARRWWKCECWWAEWFGMYMTLLLSLPGVWVVVRAYAAF